MERPIHNPRDSLHSRLPHCQWPKNAISVALPPFFAADVVGYSRLIGRDESGTLSAFKAHRHKLVDVKIAEHQGRIVKLTGDGLLVEFPSVTNAVA